MLARIAAALALAALPVLPLSAQSADSSSRWVAPLAGAWSCAGAFSNGKPLAADVVLSPALGGRWLSYHHQDRAPGRYEATALLGPALRDSALVTTTIYDNFGGHRRFIPSAAADNTITLVRDTTENGARLERFTFRPRVDGTLWFGWEIGRNGQWFLGDSLSCKRG